MADTDGEGTDRASLTRRQVVVGGAGAALGGAAGVAIFSDGLFSNSDGTTTIEKEEPNDDGEASLGELYWLLEEHPQTEYSIDVTNFQYEGDVIEVRYESKAIDQSGSDRWRWHLNELGHVIKSFGTYVAGDGPNLEWNRTAGAGGNGNETVTPGTSDPTTVPATTSAGADSIEGSSLIAHVENPYSVETGATTPAQDEVYGIKRRWVRNWIVGAWSTERILNMVRRAEVGSGD
ncbi:MAG: hypothetical protein ACI9PP_000329 [Halobacteriales archaeon]|jgi:hypothetical protein